MKIVGHRGARGLAPENTLAAISAALDAGVDEIEIDVRLSKDGVVVLLHDRVMPVGAKLQLVAFLSKRSIKAAKPDVAFLDEAISLINRRVPLMIEVKAAVPIEPVVAIVQSFLDAGWQPQDFSFGSFSQRTLEALHAAMPQIPCVVIEHFSGRRALRRAQGVDTHTISLNHIFLRQSFIRKATHRGYNVYAYTVNQPARAAKLQAAGLAGVITDRPDLFAKE